MKRDYDLLARSVPCHRWSGIRTKFAHVARLRYRKQKHVRGLTS